MTFKNAIIKEVKIKPSNTVDRPARLELTVILGNKEKRYCYIHLDDINFADKAVALMSFTGVCEMNKIVGNYVKLGIDEYGYIVIIGHILEDKYFYIKATERIDAKFKYLTEKDIEKMENK